MKEFYICVRILDFPNTPILSVKRECDQCKSAVWVDKRLGKVADKTTIICVQCHALMSKGGVAG